MPRSRFSILLAACLVCFLLANSARGQDDETYHERLEYDVNTGTWVEIPPPVPGTDAGDLAIARSMLAKNEYKDARDAFEDWFDTYPESDLRREALFYAAETEIAAEDAKPKGGDLIQAYEWLEEVIEAWPGTEIADRALRRELIVAELLLFKDRKQKVWNGMIWLTAEEEALEILTKIIDVWAPGKPIAEQALRLKGDYHYQNGDFEEAEIAYARLMRDFPRGRYRKISLLRSGQSALARFPGVEFDDADLLEADVYFRDFNTQYSAEAEAYRVPQTLQRIQDSLAHKEFTVASFYDRTNRVDSAAYYYRFIMDRWPESTWAAQSRERLTAIGGSDPAYTDVDVGGVDLNSIANSSNGTTNSGAAGEMNVDAEPALNESTSSNANEDSDSAGNLEPNSGEVSSAREAQPAKYPVRSSSTTSSPTPMQPVNVPVRANGTKGNGNSSVQPSQPPPVRPMGTMTPVK